MFPFVHQPLASAAAARRENRDGDRAICRQRIYAYCFFLSSLLPSSRRARRGRIMAALAEAEAVAWEPCCISQAFDRDACRDPTCLSVIHAATASSATRSLQIDGKVVKAKIWDTAGQDSNASDALDKLRFLSVTDPSVLADGGEMEIRIKPDPDAGTITITDTGIGMTKDELKDCLGTIAQSGTSKFLKALKGHLRYTTELQVCDFETFFPIRVTYP